MYDRRLVHSVCVKLTKRNLRQEKNVSEFFAVNFDYV